MQALSREQQRIKKLLDQQPKKFAFSTIDRTGNNAVTFQGVVYEIPAGKRKLVPAPIAELVKESERSMNPRPIRYKRFNERRYWAQVKRLIDQEAARSEEEIKRDRAETRARVLARHPELEPMMSTK